VIIQKHVSNLNGHHLAKYYGQNILKFDVFLTEHHSIDFSKYQLSAQFF